MHAKPFDAEDFISKLLSVVGLCERGDTEGERAAGMSAFKRMLARAEAEARAMPGGQGRAFLARVVALQPKVLSAEERKQQAEAEAARKTAEQARRERDAREQAARDGEAGRKREAQERAEQQDREARNRERAESHAREQAQAEAAAKQADEQAAWQRRQQAAWEADQRRQHQEAQAAATKRAETLDDILAEVRNNPRRPVRAKPLAALFFCVPFAAILLVGTLQSTTQPSTTGLIGPLFHAEIVTDHLERGTSGEKQQSADRQSTVAPKPAVSEGFTPALDPAGDLMQQARSALASLQNALDGFQDDARLAGPGTRPTLMLDIVLAKESALQAQVMATTLRYTVAPPRQAQLLDLADRLDDMAVAMRHVAGALADRVAATGHKPPQAPARPARETRGSAAPARG